jgi:hypothetical protein
LYNKGLLRDNGNWYIRIEKSINNIFLFGGKINSDETATIKFIGKNKFIIDDKNVFIRDM